MATVTEMRAWLRENTGEDIPARGRLDARWIQMYEAANGDGPGDPDWDLGDDADGMADPDDLEPSVPREPERAPRTARSARAARRAEPVGAKTSRLLGSLRGQQAKGKTGAKKKAKPRISLENFTARAWSTLGRMVAPISPATGNCLQAQAAMAGVLLEDVAQGTIVDRLLQGPARAEDKLDKVAALTLPPLVVFAIEQNQAAVQAGAKSPQQGMMRHAMLMPVLRESLRIGLEVSEQYADQIKARLEREQRFGAEIDQLIALIFGQAEATAEDVPEPEPEYANA
jgi:hypothetical protein